MSNKILVKQSGPSVFQSVGPTGSRPSFMDMARTTFAPRGGRVTVGQRARGAAGMLGKVGAAAATAQQTAERMQGGDFTAPLQVGITYQGIDPTGTMNPNIGEQIKPSETQALPTPPNPAGMQPNTTGQRPGTVGVAPTNSTFSSPIDMSQYPPIQYQGNHPVLMPAMQPQATQPQATPSTLPQSVQDQVASMGGVLGQQNIQQAPGGTGPMGDVLAGQHIKSAAFADTVFDKLGPDMVYKMTPHQIATLSAYMYLKLS